MQRLAAHSHRQHPGLTALTLTGQRSVQHLKQQIAMGRAQQAQSMLQLNLVTQQLAPDSDKACHPPGRTVGARGPERHVEQFQLSIVQQRAQAVSVTVELVFQRD